MQSIRIVSEGFAPIEKKGDHTFFRWDVQKETIVIHTNKKGEAPKIKETGNYIFTQYVAHGEIDYNKLQEVIDEDLRTRYPEGGAPVIKVDSFIE